MQVNRFVFKGLFEPRGENNLERTEDAVDRPAELGWIWWCKYPICEIGRFKHVIAARISTFIGLGGGGKY